MYKLVSHILFVSVDTQKTGNANRVDTVFVCECNSYVLVLFLSVSILSHVHVWLYVCVENDSKYCPLVLIILCDFLYMWSLLHQCDFLPLLSKSLQMNNHNMTAKRYLVCKTLHEFKSNNAGRYSILFKNRNFKNPPSTKHLSLIPRFL